MPLDVLFYSSNIKQIQPFMILAGTYLARELQGRPVLPPVPFIWTAQASPYPLLRSEESKLDCE